MFQHFTNHAHPLLLIFDLGGEGVVHQRQLYFGLPAFRFNDPLGRHQAFLDFHFVKPIKRKEDFSIDAGNIKSFQYCDNLCFFCHANITGYIAQGPQGQHFGRARHQGSPCFSLVRFSFRTNTGQHFIHVVLVHEQSHKITS